ncbi:MAG TPA: DUF6328 family protein [Minicystis sp.]|nr:DUF6328 family protein [Minicystis sp.]
MARTSAHEGETEKERVDRELKELLEELRITLPGVQILFAFLFVIPFQSSFERLGGAQRELFYAVFVAAAASYALQLAPAAYHRLCFRFEGKERMLLLANGMSIAGVLALGVAFTGAVVLTTWMITPGVQMAIASALAGAAVTTLWIILPLVHRARFGREPRPSPQGDEGRELAPAR